MCMYMGRQELIKLACGIRKPVGKTQVAIIQYPGHTVGNKGT